MDLSTLSITDNNDINMLSDCEEDKKERERVLRLMYGFVDEEAFITACAVGNMRTLHNFLGLKELNNLSPDAIQDIMYKGLIIAAQNHHYAMTNNLATLIGEFNACDDQFIESVKQYISRKNIPSVFMSDGFTLCDAEFIESAKQYCNNYIRFLNNRAHLLNNASDIIPHRNNKNCVITNTFEATIFPDEKKVVYGKTDVNVSSNITDVMIFHSLPFLGIGISEPLEISNKKIIFRGRIIEYKTSIPWSQYYLNLKEYDTIKGTLKKLIPEFGTFT